MSLDRKSDAKRALSSALDSRREDLIHLLAELVRRPSELGLESEVQTYVDQHLRASRARVDVWDLDDAVFSLPNSGKSGVPFPGRPNVTGYLGGTGSGRSLILNGHVDVVSPEPIDQWTHDPWGAEVVGNRLYGRGAFDMKSGVALNLLLPRLLNDLGITLGGDLIVHSVIEEECTGNGALAASYRDRADAAIVTEPMAGKYVQAHLGVIWFGVTVLGKGAHAGHAWQGVNAIAKTIPIVEALLQLDAALNVEIHTLWKGVHHPINLNIGVIHGGDWPSTVPGTCALRCRVSFFPDMSRTAMRARIEATIADAARRDDWLRDHLPVVSYDGFDTDGVVLANEEPFLELLKSSHREITGTALESEIATAVNDMRYYIFQGIPATCYGADGGNGHAVDEWVDLESLVPAAKALANFIVDWCDVS